MEWWGVSLEKTSGCKVACLGVEPLKPQLQLELSHSVLLLPWYGSIH